MRWLVTFVVAAVAAVAHGTPAAHADARVGLIDVPPDLERALRTALEPWAIELTPMAGPPPAGDGAAIIRSARATAARAGAHALLWVSREELWLFDATSGALSLRQIPPERDEAAVAALALSAKTMLRTTTIAPPGERFGAVATPRRSRLRLDAATALRRIATEVTRATEPRLGLARSWWPDALRGRAGVMVASSAGPGFTADGALLVARHTDTTLAVAARGRGRLGRGVIAEGGLGVSVHLTALDGYAPLHDTAITIRRTNAAIDAAVGAGVPLGDVAEVAVELGAGVALRRQRYLLGGTPVLELPLVEGRVALELRVQLH